MTRRGFLLAVAGIAACDVGAAKVTSPRKTPPASSEGIIWPEPVTHQGVEWWTSEIDLANVELDLVGQRPGEPHTLLELGPFLKARHRRLVMATNAGIFDVGRRPMGLHVQDGEMLSPLSTGNGEGNFFLKPNGVFWVDTAGGHVAACEHYLPHGPVRLATQSGPLLLDHGRIHPGFSETSRSLRLRSGVGIDRGGHIRLALSRQAVSFHAMATLFRDVLGCPDALYLDGEISAMTAPRLPLTDAHEYAGILVATTLLNLP